MTSFLLFSKVTRHAGNLFALFFSVFVNRGLRNQSCHCLECRNKFVHKIVITLRIELLLSKVIFMTSLLSLFDALSGAFVGFNDACVSCVPVDGAQSATSLLMLSVVVRLEKHGRFQRHFQPPSRVSHFVLELLVIWIDVIDSSQLSSIVELRLFKSPRLSTCLQSC